jgi:Tfp pilus assembly protein PilN
MVQFNLLPDIKLEFVKSRHVKYLLTFVSVIVGGAAITVFLFAFLFVNVVQKNSLKDLQTDIDKHSSTLKGVKDLDKILTVQNQIEALSTLHKDKPISSRNFTFLTQITPEQANLTKFTVDYAANTITIGGKAPTLDTVSDYTDTLKATRYAVDYEIKPESEADICPNMAGSQTSFPKNKAFNEKGECVDAPKAFSEVVLSQFGRDDKEATFTISLKFDPIIFSDKNKVNLLVPAGDTTDQINVFEVEN